MQDIATHPQPSDARPSRRRAALLGAGFALAAVGLAPPAAAQSSLPPVFNIPGTFTDIQNIPGISGPTTTSCSGSDDCLTSAISLPFNFSYLGQTKTGIRVSTNCWMTFDTTTSLFSDLSNDPIPNTRNPNDIIAFAWDDCRSSQMRYGTFGTAPNRVFVLESVYRYWTGGSQNAKNQIWLYEDGTIELRYADGNQLGTSSYQATIGFENAGGTAGYQTPCSPSCTEQDIAALDNRVLRVGAFDTVELAASDATFPRGALPGGTGTGTVTIDNFSTVTATTVLVDVWLSTDTTLSPGTDIRIGTATVASVPQGQQAVPVSFAVPASAAAADYNLLARVDANERYREQIEANNVGEGATQFATAYEVSGTGCRVTNSQGVNPGQTLTFEVDVANGGVPYSGPLAVQLLASADDAFGNDTALGTVTLNMTGAATQTLQGAFTLSSGTLTPGSYTPICVLDPNNAVTELAENNNIVIGGSTFGSGPDYTVTSVSVPGQVQPGSSVNITTTIANNAVPASGNVPYRLFASLDDTLDAQDALLGNFTATFAGEASVADTEAVPFASSLPGGRYLVIAVVDPRSQIAEVDEMNNQGVSSSRIVNTIDFVGQTATVDVSTVQANDPIRVTGTAASTGLSFVGNVPFGVYFSSNETFETTDIEAYRGLIFFPGNTTGSVDVTFPAPSNAPPGSYNVLLVVNPDNTPAEADTSNNVARASRQITVQGADLRAEAISAPSVAFIGRDLEVELTILNESQDADARGFRYAYYLSENDLIRVTDRQVFVSSSSTIAAGDQQTFRDQIQIPSSFTSTQTLYLGAIVDIFSDVPESNENNNIRRVPVPISVVFPIPDLQAQIVTTATSAAAGEQLAVTRLIANRGVADAPSFDFTYYLSDNPMISTDDTALQTFSSSLQTNSDDFGIDVLDIPPSVSPGTYYVGLIMDPDERVMEIDDTNNAAVGPAIPVFAAAIQFTTTDVPDATQGVPYETGVFAEGGPLPITWSVSDGGLPTGLTVDQNDGIISGTPTEEGLFDFTLRASSGTAFAERDFSIRVTSPTVPLAVATSALRSAVQSRAYSADLVAVGGVPPYTWSAISTLPTGMTFNESGRLEGSPTTPGQFTITFQVEDDVGNSATSPVPFNVVPPDQSVQIDQVPLPQPVVGRPYCTEESRVAFNAENGVPPYRWSAVGMLPPGLSLNEMGELCGTPTEAGVYNLSVRVEDSTGLFDTALFRIDIQGAEDCAISTFDLPDGQVGQPYTEEDGTPVQLTQTQCTEPLMDWMRVEGGGALPPGLDLGADGTISGTPTQDGNYGFIAMIVDATMTSVMQPLSIRVEPEPEVEETEDDGCTCATPGEERAPLAWLALLPGLALAVRRRRR